jgi:hypothetical protein
MHVPAINSIRVHSRFAFIFGSFYLRKSLRSSAGGLSHMAQRGRVRDASASARSNLRQFGSNRSTNFQNRME